MSIPEGDRAKVHRTTKRYSGGVKEIGIRRVLAVMWQGVQPWGWMFWLAGVIEIAAVILMTQIPIQFKYFFDVLSVPQDNAREVLVGILLVIVILQVCRRLLNRFGVYLISYVQARAMPRLMEIAFEYTIGHSSHFFENSFSGALVQKVRRLANAYRAINESYYFDLLPVIVQVVTSVTVLYLFQPMLAVFVVVWVVVFIYINYRMALHKLVYDIPRSALDTKVTATLADAFSNMNAIIAYATGNFESKRFKDVAESYGDILIKSWVISIIFNGILSLCIIVLEFVVFYYGIGLWERGEMSIGTFVLVQVYIFQLANNLWGFGEVIRKLHESFAESLEVVEILDMPHGVSDVPGAMPIVVPQGSIEFKNVSFAYNEARTVMDGVSVAILGGQKVAIIGPSGAGKSTFVRLLLRTYEATGGEVRIDHQNIAKVTQESLRNAIAFVPQDPSLFHRSLKENIRYGKLDATDAEVEEAAKRAHCHEFIASLPQGYDTLVGERGVKLSGGERQRVAIARAMLKDAPILVLDEATSSLDSESEVLIQKALDELIKNKTVIVIAHRLSTIRKMDRILVFDGGRIAEDGTHDELLGNPNSLYKRLWDLQAGGFIVENDESNV